MTQPPPLPGFLHTIAPVLDDYGYLAVAGFIFLEDFGVPLPGETIMIAAAVYAGTGRLNIVAVAALAFVAAVLGDNVGYLIGRKGGRPLVLKVGRYVGLTHARLDKAERWFEDHGGKVVTVARFIEGLRQANGIVAGATGMHWMRFLLFNALGAALWVGLWTTIGDVSGTHINAVYRTVSHILIYLVIAAVVLFVAHLMWRRRRRSRSADTAVRKR